MNVYKPVTSKAANSETYLVALGFRGALEATLEVLLRHVGPDAFRAAALPRAALPPRFAASVAATATFFADRTRGAIDAAVRAWSAPSRPQLDCLAKDRWSRVFHNSTLAALRHA